MTFYTTRTAELGKITFTAPAATETYSGYVWVEYGNDQYRQICHGGDFKGSTVVATPSGLKSAAQKWLRQRREWMRKDGL